MQVNQSQVSFGGISSVSLNDRANVSGALDQVHEAAHPALSKYDVQTSVKGGIKCAGGEHHCDHYYTKGKVVISKPNKTKFEKFLHVFHLLPRGTAKTTVPQKGGITAGVTAEQVKALVADAVKAFEAKRMKI